MSINLIKKLTLSGALILGSMTMMAQAPFTGSKEFKKFSIGVNAGALRPSVITGGGNDFTKPMYTLGYGANLKYQFTHRFGLQADVLMGKVKGNNDKDYSTGRPATDRLNSSFETKIGYAASLSGVLTFGSINWLNNNTRVVPYFTGGGGVISYKPTTVKTGTTTEVAFDNGKAQTEFFVPVGLGLKFMLSDIVNLDLGYRANFVDNDNFDGTTGVNGTIHKDKFSYGFLGLEFALGAKQKKQIMFDNPASKLNEILQSQITNIQTQVDTLKTATTDSDKDGVPDMFDRCPNTPAGVGVDSHGCPLDTDGDGVPDYLDKELITPTSCQPVDADGVGKCPEPDCCKNMVAAGACNLGDMPSMSFKSGNGSLNNDAKAMLATIASKMKANAECTITVTGYPVASKASQALCNRRANAVKNHLVEVEGISADRIMVNCQVGGGDANVIDVKSN
jgi:opacity protein-like surface antigen